MPFTQIKDILKDAVGYHKKVVDFYSGIKDLSDKETVKFIVDYLARHEKVLKEELSQITEEQEQKILEEWVKYPPEFTDCTCFDNIKVDKNISIDDVVHDGLQLNECLINFYHQISKKASVKAVQDLFANLEVMEITEKKKLARIEGM